MSFAKFMTDVLSEVALGPYEDDVMFKQHIVTEVVKERVYERFRSVCPGDVVFDIGANIGLFPYTLKYSRPSQVVCIEPSIALIPTLVENTSKLPFKVDVINCGIGKSTQDNAPINSETDHIYFKDIVGQTTWKTMTLQDVLDNSGWSVNNGRHAKIDFLKIDCEGYEYDIFTKQNYNFVTNHIRYIAGEFHLGPMIENSLEKFEEFKRTYLTGNNFKIFEPYHTPSETLLNHTKHNISFFWKDVTRQCVEDPDYAKKFSEYWNEHSQLMIYIDNG